jgi:hypothetical protein
LDVLVESTSDYNFLGDAAGVLKRAGRGRVCTAGDDREDY